MRLTPTSNVAMLGFGARAASFAALLAPRGCALRAWDPQLESSAATAVRARIEACGVDAAADLAAALRGARLVVLDTLPLTAALQAHMQAGQQLLDLATAPAAEIDAMLVALGLPAGSAHWATAAGAVAMANSGAVPDIPAVRRGELP